MSQCSSNVFVHVSLCTYPRIFPECLLLQGFVSFAFVSCLDERGFRSRGWNFNAGRDLDSQHFQHRDKKVGLKIIVGIIDFT